MDKLLTTKQATEMLGFSRAWLYAQHLNAVKNNKPPLVRKHKIGGFTRWSKDDIERLSNIEQIASQSTTA